MTTQCSERVSDRWPAYVDGKNPDYLDQTGTEGDDNTFKELCKEEPIMLKNSVSMHVHTCTASQPSPEHFFRFQGGPADRCLGVLEHMHLLSRAFYSTDVPWALPWWNVRKTQQAVFPTSSPPISGIIGLHAVKHQEENVNQNHTRCTTAGPYQAKHSQRV